MKEFLILGGLAVAGGAMLVDWSPGERYPLPLATARERVIHVAFDHGIVQDTASPPTLRSDAAGEHVRWTYAWHPGRPTSWCEATLAPAGATSTRAALQCGLNDQSEPARGKQAAELLRIVVHEHVAAALEGRRYDTRRMGAAMMGFAVANRAAWTLEVQAEESAKR